MSRQAVLPDLCAICAVAAPLVHSCFGLPLFGVSDRYGVGTRAVFECQACQGVADLHALCERNISSSCTLCMRVMLS